MSPVTLVRASALAALLPLLAAAPAGAQLYKWVDERGVVNYSNQPPADAKGAKRVEQVKDNVSVYTPDAALRREIEADKERPRRAEQEAVHAPQRPAVASLNAPPPASSSAPPVYIQDEIVPHPLWYGPARHLRRWRHSRPVPQVELPPGATAGLITGPNAIQPGLSSQATRYTPRPPDRPAPLVPR
jgi:hypothetical protein